MIFKHYEMSDGQLKSVYVPYTFPCNPCKQREMRITKRKVVGLVIELADVDIMTLKEGGIIYQDVNDDDEISLNIEVRHKDRNYPDDE